MEGGIGKEALEYLDEIYVRKDDCNDRHADTAKEISEITISMAKTNMQLSILVKINAFIATAVGGGLIAAILKLIIK